MIVVQTSVRLRINSWVDSNHMVYDLIHKWIGINSCENTLIELIYLLGKPFKWWWNKILFHLKITPMDSLLEWLVEYTLSQLNFYKTNNLSSPLWIVESLVDSASHVFIMSLIETIPGRPTGVVSRINSVSWQPIQLNRFKTLSIWVPSIQIESYPSLPWWFETQAHEVVKYDILSMVILSLCSMLNPYRFRCNQGQSWTLGTQDSWHSAYV